LQLIETLKVVNDIAVIFDMDGVIVDNFQYHEKAWKKFCENHEIILSDSFRSKVFGGTNKDHLETFFNRELTSDEISIYEEEKEQLYREIYGPFVKPVAGLLPFLKKLKRTGIPIALATSSPPVNVKFILNNTGTGEYFKIVVDASMIEKGKPDPEIYLKTSRGLEMEPTRCIVFEDSNLGIRSAVNAGMKVIGLSTTLAVKNIKDASFIIPDFTKISISQLLDLAFKQG